MTEPETVPVDATLEASVVDYLRERTGRPEVDADVDVFETGLLSSMFAMELIVHLEQTYGVAIAGPDLKMANFRTARSIAALVCRLRATAGGDD